ncbi:MAG TPA: DedA family protein [Solirubrobacteraceae bacterium]|nr:DedA family protein [Solirubrobacteraceae bacterium]
MLAFAALINLTSGLGYGLPAIIGLESMGVPSPGETALVLAAVLASQGKLEIWLVIVIGVSSAILGDNIGYLLGRRLGRDVLESKGPFHESRLELIAIGDQFFAKHGSKAVFFARWIALVRFAAAWLAGINHMRFREFFFWNALGGITWGVTYGLVGYFLGSAAADAISTFGLYAFGGLLLLFLAWVYYALRKRRRERELRQAARAERAPDNEHRPDGDAPGSA